MGCAIARELSRYRLSVLVLEKEYDVAFGTSGRNSAVVHAGFNNRPGSLMAKLCVEGSRRFENICRDLDVPYKKTGKVLAASDEEDLRVLRKMIAQGEANGCEGLRLIGRKELGELVPRAGGIGGMFSPNTAVFDPFLYCVALAENAAANGAGFLFGQEVTGLEARTEGFSVKTGKDRFTCRYLVNAAGLYCDKISGMLGADHYQIHPCRGEYLILDRIADEILPVPVYPVPKPGTGGLGVHLTPTIHGNVLIGPGAEYIGSRDDYASTPDMMEQLFGEAQALLPGIRRTQIIGSYSGIRPKQSPPGEGGFRDFIIQEEPACPGFINLIGIESPGLTASVPIAEMVCGIIGNHEKLRPKKVFQEKRKGIVRFRELDADAQNACIRENPEYGEIVCRCQKVTKYEIRRAIENPLGAVSLSSIKYRAWPMTGRCSGGYCLGRIAAMLTDEYGIKPEDIVWRSEGSGLFSGEVK